MIATDLLCSEQYGAKEKSEMRFFEHIVSLFPTPSFAQEEVAQPLSRAEETVWIEGTVTVSF